MLLVFNSHISAYFLLKKIKLWQKSFHENVLNSEMSACTALYEFLSDIINSKDKSFVEWGRVVFFPVNFAKLHILSPAIGVRKKISQVPNPDSNLCFAIQFCFYFNSSKTEKSHSTVVKDSRVLKH